MVYEDRKRKNSLDYLRGDKEINIRNNISLRSELAKQFCDGNLLNQKMEG